MGIVMEDVAPWRRIRPPVIPITCVKWGGRALVPPYFPVEDLSPRGMNRRFFLERGAEPDAEVAQHNAQVP
jgi:hypothetical protein